MSEIPDDLLGEAVDDFFQFLQCQLRMEVPRLLGLAAWILKTNVVLGPWQEKVTIEGLCEFVDSFVLPETWETISCMVKTQESNEGPICWSLLLDRP